MVGNYNDPQFGNMQVKGFANIAPPTLLLTPPATSVFDSLVLQLSLDFYHYGSSDSSQLTMQVFEVLDTIHPLAGYYTTTQVAYGTQPLGEVKFGVNPTSFDESLALNADRDTSNNVKYNVRVVMDGGYGASLLNDMIKNPALFRDVNSFIGKYKGFAFVMKDGNKIIGINPVFTGPAPKGKDTKLSLYYSDGAAQSRADYPLYYANNFTTGTTFPGVSFTTITTDRSPTVLSGIELFKDFVPINQQFYVQSSTALITKMDLTSFYDFADTLGNIVFNSAELVMNNISQQTAPSQVQLRFLDSTNGFRSLFVDSLVNGVVKPVLDPYLAKIPKAWAPNTTSNAVDVRADQGSVVRVSTDKTIGKFFITEFCQQIYRYKTDPRRVKAIALMPIEAEFQKSVSSLVLDPGVSLRLYYTRPLSTP